VKLGVSWKTDFDFDGVAEKINEACRKGLVTTITDIANYAVKHSPYLTGNNRRSIMFEVGPNKSVAKKDLEAATYSTSGYGGFLEVGTATRPARPYFRPGLAKFAPELPKNIKDNLK